MNAPPLGLSRRYVATWASRGCAAVLGVLALACVTDDTSGSDAEVLRPVTDAAGSDAPDAHPPADAAPVSSDGGEPTRDGGTPDAATPTGCGPLCARVADCALDIPLAACTSSCESAAEPLRRCLLACDSTTCDDLLACTTRCAQPGNPSAPPYGRCADGCRPGTTICVGSTFTATVTYAVCAPPCDADGACPLAATGQAVPECATEAEPLVCRLSCSSGARCPDEMVCHEGSCTWPVP